MATNKIKAHISVRRETTPDPVEEETTTSPNPDNVHTQISVRSLTPTPTPDDPSLEVPNPEQTDTTVIVKPVANYDKLLNKPSINNVVVQGDKTGNDYGLANIEDVPTKVSDLENDVSYQTQEEVDEKLALKQDNLTAGENISIDSNNVISAAGDKEFIFEQGSVSDKWVITHNLDKYPSVTVEDSAHNIVIGEVYYENSNTLIIRFNGAFSGKAYLN